MAPGPSFRTSHQIPTPVVRAAGLQAKPRPGLDPRDDATDGFATSHKITRDAPARRLDEKYDKSLEEKDSGEYDTPAPPQPARHAPKLLKLLGGSAHDDLHLPLVQLNPALLPGTAQRRGPSIKEKS